MSRRGQNNSRITDFRKVYLQTACIYPKMVLEVTLKLRVFHAFISSLIAHALAKYGVAIYDATKVHIKVSRRRVVQCEHLTYGSL